MSLTNEFIAKRIREARKQRGKTQAEIAKLLGKTTGAVSQLEQGNVQISVIELHKISGYLNKPIEFFYGEEYLGDDVQTLISIIRKMDPEIRKEQVAIIRSLLFMQEFSDEFQSKGEVTEEEGIDEAKRIYPVLVTYLSAIKSLWEKGQLAKEKLDELIGIGHKELQE